MKVEKKKWIRIRVYIVALFFVLGLGTILARAYQLQVVEDDYLKGIADKGIFATITLPPDRGFVYDRAGNELAVSIQVGSVFAHPSQIKEKQNTARKLSQILHEPANNILQKLQRKRSFVWIKRRISPALTAQVSGLNLSGVGITTEAKRFYPEREIAAHLIGFSGTDNQGLEGLERKYDRYLTGPQHKLVCMEDAFGRPFAIDKPVSSGEAGVHHLTLTIDKEVQYKAQQALHSAVTETRAKGGHCLVVNPKTGEILAMAVVPQFNPNIFSKFRPDKWRNRAVTDSFEPGSTMKAFLLSAALEQGVVTPLTEFFCEEGKYKVGGRVVHDTHEYETLTVADIVVRSSNIGAVKIGQKLGYETFCQYLKKFGFGQKTGVDLLGERTGFIRAAKHAKTIDQANLYFGQGMSTTSLQLVMGMAAIANGGKLMRPYVVKEIVDESGHQVKETQPKVVRRVISLRTAKTAASILTGVVGEEGTAPKAAINGFSVAGKTGTAQKVDPETKGYSKQKYVATFVGFTPADDPELVILVVIDEPKGTAYGGLVAAPVFQKVGSWALNHLRVAPRRGLLADVGAAQVEQSPVSPIRPDAIAAAPQVSRIAQELRQGVLPDFTDMGMREVLKKGRDLGLEVCLKGSGLAVTQHPEPGSPLLEVDSVQVNFKPPGR
ncbi:MAG: penicillin-binding protein [Desulfatiglandaceae bacterium]